MYSPTAVNLDHFTLFCSFLKQNNAYHHFYALTREKMVYLKKCICPLNYMTCGKNYKGWSWSESVRGNSYWIRLNDQWTIYYLNYLLATMLNDTDIILEYILKQYEEGKRFAFHTELLQNEYFKILKEYDIN